MMQKVRIGIIGAGNIVQTKHLPNLKKIKDVEIVAVCNLTRESAKQVAKDYAIPRIVNDWHEVIAMDDLDALLIGAPPYLHCEATIAALEAGKHVFCQARMARNYQEAKAMYEKSLKTDRVAMLCPSPAGMLGDYFVKKLISEDYLGKIYDIHVIGLSSSFADPDAPLHWRQDFEISGYNTLTLGIYIETLHRWFGYARRINAITRVHVPKRKRLDSDEWAEVKIPDSLGITAEMENGALTVCHFSGVTRFPSLNRYEIYGSEGTLIYYIDSDEIYGAKVGDPELSPLGIPKELLREWTVEEDFIAAIREGRPVSPSFFDGLKYMEFTEAVMLSAKAGKSVNLPLDG